MNKLKKLFGYGIGDFGLNIYWQTVSLFLVYWYTSIVGIDPKIAGLIFFIGMAWDAISDPIMLSLSERVNTRWGTYRPFLLFGSLFTALAFVLLFWVPPFEGRGLILFLIFACLIFRTSYTIVAIPYSAMASRITYDSIERADFSGARMFFAFFALLTVSLFLWPAVEHLTETTGSAEKAFQYAAIAGGMLSILALTLCFSMTKELPLPAKTVRSEKVWTGIYRNVATNKALKVLLLIILLKTASGSCFGITLIFFIEANQAGFAAKEVIYTALAITALVFVPFWSFFIHKVGRKKIWVLTSVLYALIATHMIVYGPTTLYGVPVHILLFSACSSAHAIIFWAFIPDAVEYGQVTSGYRSEAGVFGAVLITQKLSGGAMGFMVGFVLSSLGIAKDNLTAETLGHDLTIFIALFPALFLILSIIPIFLLPMGRDTHKQIVDDLITSDQNLREPRNG